MGTRRVPPFRPQVDPLEARLLFNADAPGRRIRAAAAGVAAVGRPELDEMGSTLVAHPGLAGRLGLGGLAEALRDDGAIARASGWGAALAFELATHPAYAAARGLTHLIWAAPPAAPLAASRSDEPTATRADAAGPFAAASPAGASKGGIGIYSPIWTDGVPVIGCCETTASQVAPPTNTPAGVPGPGSPAASGFGPPGGAAGGTRGASGGVDYGSLVMLNGSPGGSGPGPTSAGW